MAAEPNADHELLADRLESAITSYAALGVDSKGRTHYLSADRTRVAVIDGEPETDLVEEAELVQHLGPGDVPRWIDHVQDVRGWAEFDVDMVVALAGERGGD